MKRILIIKPSSMGDILHAFPAVNGLLQSDPELCIDWVIHPAFEELLDYLPLQGRRILFRRKELGRPGSFLKEVIKLIRELRVERYDASLDLQGLFRSAILGLPVRTSLRYGPAHVKEFPAKLCYNRLLHWKKETRHALEKNCDLVSSLLDGREIVPDYTLPAVERYVRTVDALLEREGLSKAVRFIAIAPGARWVTKQWAPECFIKCILLLEKAMPGTHFVLLGSPGEKELCSRIAAELTGKVSCTDLCAKTSMGELLEVIRRADILLCNDSGPMHAAAAAGTPSAAFFAPTDPDLTGPYSPKSIVLRPDLPCLNCFRKQCDSSRCRSALSPEEMAHAVEILLQQERSRS